MAAAPQSKSLFFGALEFLDLIFHSVVREVRTQSGNATFGVLKEVGNIAVFLALFYTIAVFLGRGASIRGSLFVFLLTGIILFLTHTKAVGSVRSASSATSAIMMHSPMTVILSILAKAFAGLYFQFVAVSIIITLLWIFGADLTVDNPGGLVLPVFFAWASGIAVGMVFMIFSPVVPGLINAISPIYQRAQMFTSGKFIPAAYMPAAMVGWFDWNPLFHTIDQARVAAFVNYNSDVSNMAYPIWFTVVAITIGLMGEFWARKNLSKSKHGQ
ncbi:MAG: ABC transporter permease [Rhodobacteraceae bacterium]|nr:ABC transporter permease [Paracoccaceae bacterium]